jgi:hypothetical protein
MRLKSYITESTMTKKDWIVFDDIWKRLRLECRPFLREMKKVSKGLFLWRGYKSSVKNYKYVVPRSDRSPTDMPEELQDILDDLFNKKFRWMPRSGGVFTTGNRRDSSSYGTPNLFFACNKYKILWAPRIPDLYSEFEGSEFLQELDAYTEDEWSDEYEREYGEGSDGGSWHYDDNDTDLTDYDEAEEYVINDVLDGDEYEIYDNSLMAWVPHVETEDFYNQKEHEWHQEREYFIDDKIGEYTDKNLPKAIKSGNEVMVKCPGYYLVDDKFKDALIGYIWEGGYQHGLPDF